MIFAAALLAAAPAPVRAQERHEAQGFAGASVGTSTFGSAVAPAFGGRIGIGLTDHIQIIGEAGRLAELESPLPDVLGFTDLGISVNAWYGEAGAKFIASTRAHVRPYGEVTIGFARLNASIRGLPDSEFIDAALEQVNKNRRIFGTGGGVQFGGGAIAFDIGYRYKQISVGDTLAATLNEGKPYHVNQVRGAAVFRF